MSPPVSAESLSPLEQQQLHVADPAAETFWHRVRFRLVAAMAIDSGATAVLDIGAGSGLLGDWLHRHHPELGYRFEELSPALDSDLAARFGADARGDGGPIAADTFVVMLDVLEHIADDAGALHELLARMSPGGRAAITVPALQWAFSSWDDALGHQRRYSRARLRALASACGVRVVSAAYLFPELLPLLPVRMLRKGARADVDFPRFGAAVTRVGEAIGNTTTRLRRAWPAGTSVVVLLEKPAP